ncbi:glucuronate isomerase [Pseudoclavibacter sp. AY1F1]|uniref:glucuronate isomerase n=1 Tax=Pseudoclavibacter sp. AY1F1 TaxID=2080583 RepID=UPI000CE8443F|nr:glucuronate isomerase [Pseudoclavibacter sp. AY1F1]PPF45587.1 glucuronate isomerase [Pseudoclavibacter sp. AY1F1]
MPSDARTRGIAEELYASVADSPIISPHGHVSAELFRLDVPFEDPTELLVTSDHYVTRLLHANGVDYEDLHPSDGSPAGKRAWHLLASHWHEFAGTASGYWLDQTFREVFGIEEELTEESADRIYSAIDSQLRGPAFRPRALFDSFGVEVLATTNDPLDDLDDHAVLRDDATFTGRVLPTFRPDAYLDPSDPSFVERIDQLHQRTGRKDTFAGYLLALEDRRAHFLQHGAVSADHGVGELRIRDLGAERAAELYTRARRGQLTAAESSAFQGHMLLEMGRMSARDGLVMTIHPGVRRNHSSATFQRYGSDTGHDIPFATHFTDEIRPLLEEVGLTPGMHIVLFAVDETVYSREIAPLAGFYPSVFIGAPWWFLDAPDAGLRFREAVTETAGFYRHSGFIDDTRAFLSIPTRHDMARRLDAAFLARLVVEGRVRPTSAKRIIKDLVETLPRKVFKL